ncbi:MAG: bifunctional folylpolyglutamate synthase/dihydrofolate synthase [Deltaproteobacteria bacterium]|nr:bifunctional folylpolyglutamate synthase/dihydrofolate synthase [Deltaproteobacteria bacterium]
MKKTDSLSPGSYENFVSQLADREYFGQKLGLERIQRLLDQLGNPEKRFPSIHIAGTNGKGSTAAMIATILKEAGYRVGLYTSPHLIDFCERIRILSPSITHPQPLSYIKRGESNPPIQPGQVLHYARLIKEAEEEPLTFFELPPEEGKEPVDIAVIEVGMGGRLDATNVITPLVSVITTIGLDHTQYLGDSIEKIAFEKAGIIKPGVPVVVGDLPEGAAEVLRTIISPHRDPHGHQDAPLSLRGAKIIPALFEGGYKIGLSGSHQQQNAAVAMAVIAELRRQGWSISDAAVSEGLANIDWPGRLQTIQEEPWILIDGAHNPEAMGTVRRYLEQSLQGRRLKVLFTAMADKDISGMLGEIGSVASEIVVTELPMKRAASSDELLRLAKENGMEGQFISPPEKAFQLMRESLKEDEVLLATGSFYLVGELLRCLLDP